jgi:multicomponent Na+:H+ antiporter subunit D
MRREWWLAAMFAVGLLSLVGLPPTSGLWGKVGLVLAAVGVGGWEAWVYVGAIVAASIASMLALQYLWGEVFWGAPQQVYWPASARTGEGPELELPETLRARAGLVAPGTILLGTSVAIFVAAGWLMPVVTRAGAGLLDLAPYVEAVLG